jgi:hypothetical protein
MRILWLVAVVCIGVVVASITLDAQSWQCSGFTGYCPEGACDIVLGNHWNNLWPTSCGLQCVCDQWEIAYYRMNPELQSCLELCDYGYDGWCDCAWIP